MGVFEWIASKPTIELLLVGLGLILDGILGAWISTHVRAQSLAIWFTFLSGNISLLVWAYLAKFSKMTLPTASILFDCVYNFAWFLALIYLGQKMTPVQLAGIVLVTLGIALLGYHTPVP